VNVMTKVILSLIFNIFYSTNGWKDDLLCFHLVLIRLKLPSRLCKKKPCMTRGREKSGTMWGRHDEGEEVVKQLPWYILWMTPGEEDRFSTSLLFFSFFFLCYISSHLYLSDCISRILSKQGTVLKIFFPLSRNKKIYGYYSVGPPKCFFCLMFHVYSSTDEGKWFFLYLYFMALVITQFLCRKICSMFTYMNYYE